MSRVDPLLGSVLRWGDLDGRRKRPYLKNEKENDVSLCGQKPETAIIGGRERRAGDGRLIRRRDRLGQIGGDGGGVSDKKEFITSSRDRDRRRIRDAACGSGGREGQSV